MGGSESKPLVNARATHQNLQAVLVGGRNVRVFDSSSQPDKMALVEVCKAGGEETFVNNGVAFSSNGNFLAYYDGYQNGISVVEMKTGTVAKVIGKGEKHSFGRQVLFSKDDKYIYFINPGVAVADIKGSKEIFVYEVESGDLKSKIQGHEANLNAISISRCGNFLASGDLHGHTIIWDLKSSATSPKMIGKPIVAQGATETSQITTMTFSGNSKFLYTVFEDRDDPERMFKPITFGYEVSNPEHKQCCGLGVFCDTHVFSLELSGCGNLVFGSLGSTSIRVFEIEDEGYLKTKFDTEVFSANVDEIGCSKDNILAVCCSDHSLHLYDLKIQKRTLPRPIDVGNAQYKPVFTPDGTILAGPCSHAGLFHIYGVFRGAEVGASRPVKKEKIVYQTIAFSSADGSSIEVTGGEKGEEKETLTV